MNNKLIRDIHLFLEGDICTRELSKIYNIKLSHTEMLEFERMYQLQDKDKTAVTELIIKHIREENK